MPFRARLHDKPISAVRYGNDAWESLRAAVRKDPSALILECCGGLALPATSQRGNHFFRHRTRPETCDWGPESDEHIDLKTEVAKAIATVGWSSEEEKIGPDWKADVLATRGKASIAFEIQLSPQGQAQTTMREERDFKANVLPWWIVNNRNNGKGFGSDRRLPLVGDSATERVSKVAQDVIGFLRRVERHVEIARALKRVLAKRNLAPKVEGIGGIPSVFWVELTDGLQPIVVGELGAGAFLDIDDVIEKSEVAPWGAASQFVDGDTKQVKGFGATAFYLRSKDLEREIGAHIDRLLGGKVRWIGAGDKEKIEASFVWYDDICGSCRRDFVRVPFLLHAHHKHWPKRPTALVAFRKFDEALQEQLLGALERRLGRKVGKSTKDPFLWAAPIDAPLSQECPHCGATCRESLVNADEALNWPYPERDFWISAPVEQTGWLEPRTPAARVLPSQKIWESRVQAACAQRDEREAEKERIRIDREEASRADQERYRQEREQGRARAAEVAKQRAQEAAERERAEQEVRQAERAERLEGQRAEAEDRLRRQALAKWRAPEKVDLFMKSFDTKLQGRPFEICGDRFEACAKRLAELR